jgi:hypothetical protein
MSPAQRKAAGLAWFRATYPKLIGTGTVRVSCYYPPAKKATPVKKGTWHRQHATWAFEFPLKDLKSAASVTYCVCQSDDGATFIHCLRVPHQYVLDHRPSLYERIDKSGEPSIGVFLAADIPVKFRDERQGPGGIEFGQFLLP